MPTFSLVCSVTTSVTLLCRPHAVEIICPETISKLQIMMPPKFQLLAVMAFGVAMLLIENQIQKLDESRAKLGKIRLLEAFYTDKIWRHNAGSL
ncbi:hypothetical protein DNTS_029736 [Danionella cerebrum]|uniref:Uncharacterized protein n=1 Tax=Danionella cerebrum TaxID=2873325 RepID=A0A553P520_9TELE|nr:hypothetical protein DNTS_029736 [Danionella translucida]